MNNEPVAWMQTWENQDGTAYHTVDIERIGKNDIPLYTHPVKELTDEEITEIVADKYEKGHGRYIDTDLFFIEFARAILKKASEK